MLPPRFFRLAAASRCTAFDARFAALAGQHRIQRVPDNDKRGRRHSSVVTVAAIPQVDTDRLTIPASHVRVDTFRATGPGGQHRNKTDSGVRLVHLPTGVTVTATEDRSQHVNRAVAWDRLRVALEARAARAAARATNDTRVSAFELHRAFLWTAWRDEVRTAGRRARMSSALRGELGPLMG